MHPIVYFLMLHKDLSAYTHVHMHTHVLLHTHHTKDHKYCTTVLDSSVTEINNKYEAAPVNSKIQMTQLSL